MNETLKNYITNLIRTGVPVVVAAIVSWVKFRTGRVDPATMSLFFGIVGTAYYGVIRAAEIKWPKIAWLLGALPVPAANVPPVTPTPPAVTIPPVASKG